MPPKRKKKGPARKAPRRKEPEPIREDPEEEPPNDEQPQAEVQPLRIVLRPARASFSNSEEEEDELDSESQDEEDFPRFDPLGVYFREIESPDPEPFEQPVGDKNNSGDEEDAREEEEEDEEEEEEEEDEEEDEDQHPPTIPVKRKKGAKAVQNQKKKARKQDNIEKASSEEPVVPIIGYTITTVSAEEMKKAVARRKTKSCFLEISSQLEWVDVKGRLKIAICDKLFPGEAEVTDDRFEMAWSIPRVVPHPLSLSTAGDYEILVKKALKAKEPGVKISVEEIKAVVNHRNDQENAPPPMPPANAGSNNHANEAPARPKNKEKSKSRKSEADILPANVAINEKIKALRVEWECSAARCPSDMCFVPAEGNHLPLGMEHLEKWAAAILAGTATLQAPPNHKLFDALSTNKIMSKSPLLQARLNAKNNAQASVPTPAPVFNVVLPNNFGVPYPNVQVPGGLGDAMPIAANTTHSKTLIPNGYINGARMDIATFCSIYNIPESIRARLQENEITGTHAFSHISESDLQDMGFKLGQRIDLKEAIKEWAQAVTPAMNY